jgi:hypothetical protein
MSEEIIGLLKTRKFPRYFGDFKAGRAAEGIIDAKVERLDVVDGKIVLEVRCIGVASGDYKVGEKYGWVRPIKGRHVGMELRQLAAAIGLPLDDEDAVGKAIRQNLHLGRVVRLVARPGQRDPDRLYTHFERPPRGVARKPSPRFVGMRMNDARLLMMRSLEESHPDKSRTEILCEALRRMDRSK